MEYLLSSCVVPQSWEQIIQCLLFQSSHSLAVFIPKGQQMFNPYWCLYIFTDVMSYVGQPSHKKIFPEACCHSIPLNSPIVLYLDPPRSHTEVWASCDVVEFHIQLYLPKRYTGGCARLAPSSFSVFPPFAASVATITSATNAVTTPAATALIVLPLATVVRNNFRRA